MVHVRVSELRAALRTAGTPLLTRDGGYLLRIDSDEVDAGRFGRLAAAGAAALAEGDPQRARADLQAGLALWRGPALAEFADEPFARSDAARLEELRLQVVENRIAADLELGGPGELVAELEKLVAVHPLRERFWAQHMLALYRAGRRGEALQAYAIRLTQQEESEADRRACIDRLLDYYLATAAAAVDRLYPTDAHRRPRNIRPPSTPVPELVSVDAARAWLDAERPTMVAVAAFAAAHGWPSPSVNLSTVLFHYLDSGSKVDALAIHGYAREAAESGGDAAGQAEALNGLGVAHLRLGRYHEASEYHTRALAIFRDLGERYDQGWPSTTSARPSNDWVGPSAPFITCGSR